MTVSVLIPTYNRREHTLRAIDSVLAQTAPVAEIIVVDDGSSDGTAEAIRSRYGGRVAVYSQKNAGVSAARNRCLREARGEWVAFLDSDDVWLREKLASQFEALSALGGEFGACFTNCVFEGNPEMTRSAFEDAGLKSESAFGALDDPPKYVLGNPAAIYIQSLLVRRSLLEQFGGFDESMVVSEDTDVLFWLGCKTRFCFVTGTFVRIDRTPSRRVGLCELYGSRDDRKYESLDRLYSRWLSMPEIDGSAYERPIRDLQRRLRYDSAASKIRQFRIGPAFREMARLNDSGETYAAIMVSLFSRKVGKLLGSTNEQVDRERPQSANLVPNQADARDHLL